MISSPFWVFILCFLALSNAWLYTVQLKFTSHETLYFSENPATQLSNGKGTSIIVGSAGVDLARYYN